jgi:hypothetical protein
MLIPSVVVYNFDVNGTNARPYEADAPLVVDANTVLTLSITVQSLKAIARRSLQKIHGLGCLQLSELSLSN